MIPDLLFRPYVRLVLAAGDAFGWSAGTTLRVIRWPIKAGTGAAAPSAQSDRLSEYPRRGVRAPRCYSRGGLLQPAAVPDSVVLKAHCSGGVPRAAQPPSHTERAKRYSLIHEGIAGNPTPARVCGGRDAPPT